MFPSMLSADADVKRDIYLGPGKEEISNMLTHNRELVQ